MDMDDRFANGAYIAGAGDYPEKWAGLAAAFRDNTRCELDVAYGPTARQKMDIFYPEGTPLGVVMFVHGGYWLAFDKSYWSHLATGPLAHGWAVAIPSYDLCPDVHKFAAQRIDGPMRFAGHSAGGHLVARLAGMDWHGRLDRVLPISPVSDLTPLLLTSMNAQLRLSAQEAFAESPVNMMPRAPVTVWVGGAERPVFLEQAQELADAWQCGMTVSPREHHFNVIEPLADSQSPIVRALLS